MLIGFYKVSFAFMLRHLSFGKFEFSKVKTLNVGIQFLHLFVMLYDFFKGIPFSTNAADE